MNGELVKKYREEDREFQQMLDDVLRTTVSAQFRGLALFVVNNVEPGPERTVALRKLLEAKDAAVRATVHPGG